MGAIDIDNNIPQITLSMIRINDVLCTNLCNGKMNSPPFRHKHAICLFEIYFR